MEQELSINQELMRVELNRCVIIFDEHPLLSQRRAKLMTNVFNLYRELWKMIFKFLKKFSVILSVVGVVMVLMLGVGLKKLLEILEAKAKKIR